LDLHQVAGRRIEAGLQCHPGSADLMSASIHRRVYDPIECENSYRQINLIPRPTPYSMELADIH
jgi:hypothetical protein